MRSRYFVFFSILLWPSVLEGTPPEPPAPSLLGTTDGLIKLNQIADQKGMARIEDDEELEALVGMRVLLSIPSTVCVDSRLEEKWRWVLPQTAYFLGDIGTKFREEFGGCLKVTSATRTIRRQNELIRVNPNAVPARGKRRSLHLTGSTVDVTKVGMKKNELAWLRKTLIRLKALGLVYSTEEKYQAVFHITVLSEYVDTAN